MSNKGLSPPSPPSIAIIGGGITGLLTLLSIAQHAPHLLPNLTLYEAAHKFGEIGAGVAFGPNAVRAMNKISPSVAKGFSNVSTANKDAAKHSTWFDFWYAMAGPEEGKHICERKLTSLGGENGGMVHRASFLDEMVGLVPKDARVEFNKKAIGIKQDEDGVVIKFADGSEARHDAVLGCDGIKSQTRIELLGPGDPAAHAVFTGKYCYRGLIPMDQAVKAVGEQMATNSQMYLGNHGHMLTFPVRGGKIMNVVAFSSAKEWEDKEWVVHAERDKMYLDYEGWGGNVRKILHLMQKPDIWALFNHLPAKSYCGGRICLIGDGELLRPAK
jgi:salicylate hydroxylase